MCSFIKSISKSKYLLKLNVHFCLRSIIGKEWGNLRENLKKMPRKRREEEGIHGKQAKSLDCRFANFWSDLPTGCCFYLPKYQAQICHWRIIENWFRSWIEPLSYARGQKKLDFSWAAVSISFFILLPIIYKVQEIETNKHMKMK